MSHYVHLFFYSKDWNSVYVLGKTEEMSNLNDIKILFEVGGIIMKEKKHKTLTV